MNQLQPKPKLTALELKRLRTLADGLGDQRAAQLLHVHASTMNKAISGRKVRPSIVQCLRSALRDMDDLP